MNNNTSTTNTSVSKKTLRKNKTNLTLNWPANTEYFTVESLSTLNPDFVNITLRVRLKRAIDEEKTVGVIGTINAGKGRPRQVLAMRPVTQSVLDKAKKDGVMLEDQSRLVNVMNVAVPTTSIPTATKLTVATKAEAETVS